MNKDERSAALTGADTERHGSNDLNPTSAPALSLPIQRLGSAMKGYDRFDALLGFLESQKFHPDASHVPPDFRDGYNHALRAVMERVETERSFHVEALRQRPGAQAASEPVISVKDRPGTIAVNLLRVYFERAINDTEVFAARFPLARDGEGPDYACPNTQGMWLGFAVGMRCAERLSNAAATPAGERPAQAEPMTDDDEVVAWAYRRNEPQWDGDNVTGYKPGRVSFVAREPQRPLPNEDVAPVLWVRPVRASAILASQSASERPGAQALQRIPDDAITVNLVRLAGLDKHKARECEAIVRQLLAAPSTGGAACPGIEGFVSGGHMRKVLDKFPLSTGGAETAEPCEQGCHEKLEGRTACVGRCKQAARAAASSSAPAQAVETAGVREQDFEKGWRTAANWMERDDLIADIGGAAYLKDRAAALQSPAASPASKEQTNGGPSHE